MHALPLPAALSQPAGRRGSFERQALQSEHQELGCHICETLWPVVVGIGDAPDDRRLRKAATATPGPALNGRLWL